MSRLALPLRAIAIALLVVVASFAGTAPAVMAQTLTPAPTQTPAPSLTPEPSPTPEPTLTPAPSETPEPTQTPVPSLTPEPTPTPAPAATLTINGSESVSVHVVTTDSIAFNASSGWIAFFRDSACTTYLGLMESPSDDAAPVYAGAWGSTFFVTGATRSGTPTTTCRQVTVSPPMFLIANGSQSNTVLLGAEVDLVIGLPGGQADKYTLSISLTPDCSSGSARPLGGGNTTIPYAELHQLPGFAYRLWIQAKRTVDGVQTSCRVLEWLQSPSPLTPIPTVPQQPTGTVPASSTAPIDPTSTPDAQPTCTAAIDPTSTPNIQPTGTAPVTLLPSTGDGRDDSSSGMPVWLLGAAFTILMAALAVGRRQGRTS